MGCSQSKIENEEAVSRCKDRKQHMREAVSARNAFAAAHAAYAVSLKSTGGALTDYSQDEFLHQPHHLPHSSSFPGSSSTAVPNPSAAVAAGGLPPPPPPMPAHMDVSPPPPPLQRAVTMPEFGVSESMPPERSETIPEGDEDEMEGEEDDVDSEAYGLRRRRRGKSAGGGVGQMGGGRVGIVLEEDGPPPPPPETPPPSRNQEPPPPPPAGNSTWDFFFSDHVHGGGLTVDEDLRDAERERVEAERRVYEERAARATEIGNGGVGVPEIKRNTRKVDQVPVVVEKPPLPPQQAGIGPGGGKMVKKSKPVATAGLGAGEVGKRVPKVVNPLKIFGDLDDHFLQASESAQVVVKMLEAARLHYHSSFAKNCGHIDHSERVMQVITWNRSFRIPTNNVDKKDDFDSEENETHATVLDKLLAWEKKLYDEVKAGELMKFEYQKKVALLNKLKKRNASSESLEKTKAAVSHLHTRYIVDMQSLDSTVSEINRLRDQQLYPKLVVLVDAMAVMWEEMQEHHRKQLDLVARLRAVDPSQSVKETNVQHHERTIALWVVVQEWHIQFDKMVSHQKSYIQALKNWLKLNLIPIESNLKEKVSSPPRSPNPPIERLLLAWHNGLEKIPEEHAKTAIYNFSAGLHTIVQQQDDEIKLRSKVDESRKDLARRMQQFEDWYNKYKQRRMPSDDVGPDGPHYEPTDPAHDEPVVERKVELEAAQKRLEELEESYQRQCLHVREKSLTSLKTRMPELFRAMCDFSLACLDMYKDLSMMSHSKQQHKDSSL